jgi:predicted SprT family Zn-dependent metalloprotease
MKYTMEILFKYEEFANKLLKEHNLTDWKFVFNTRTTSRTLGICKHRRKEIHISKRYALVGSEELIIDTIIHEVAHALTKGHGHDNIWKSKCIELGCKPNRFKKLDDSINIKLSRYKGVCPTCGHEIYSCRNNSKRIHIACANNDYNKFGKSNFKNHIYVWKSNENFIDLLL